MATRKPTVMLDSGRLGDLPSGDTLGLTSETGQIIMVADDTLATLTPVYVSAAGHVDKAQADASGTATAIGLTAAAIASAASGVVQTNGIIAGTTGAWDAVTGDVGGLTFNATYFLDPDTAGMLTTTKPTAAGDFVAIVGVALSTTEMDLRVGEPYLLS